MLNRWCTLFVCCGIILAISGCGQANTTNEWTPSAAASPTSNSVSHPKLQHVQVGDINMAYYQRGSGPPLVMIMGSASTQSEWDPALLSMLEKHYRLLLFDNRGMGQTTIPRKGTETVEQLADDTSGLMKKLHIDKAYVLGWSLGGYIAQQMAVKHPSQVKALILAGTNPGGDHTTLGPKWAQRIDSDPNPTDAQALSVLFPRDKAGKRAAKQFLGRVTKAADNGSIPDDFHVSEFGMKQQLRAESRWFDSNKNWKALRKLTVPVLLLGGTDDVLTPPQNMQDIQQQIPGSQLVLFPKTGHAFLFQDSKEFTSQLISFLSNVR